MAENLYGCFDTLTFLVFSCTAIGNNTMVDKRNCEVGTTSATVKWYMVYGKKDAYVTVAVLLNIVTNIRVSYFGMIIGLYKIILLHGVNVEFIRS